MPRLSDHLVKSAIRLVRQSTTVPNTSNTKAFTAEISDMSCSPVFLVIHDAQLRIVDGPKSGISRFWVQCFALPRNGGIVSKHLAILDEPEIVGNLVIESTRLRVARLRQPIDTARIRRLGLLVNCLDQGP